MRSRDQGTGARGWGRKARFWVLGAGCWVVLGILGTTAASQSGIAKGNPESNPSQELAIALRVYDYAGVEPAEYARAQREVSSVLRRAGLVAIWIDCQVPGTKPHGGPTSQRNYGAPGLVLRILSRSMALGLPLEKGTLGFAQQSMDATPADVANVFYYRVEELAGELECPRGVILGHALAHEIGHLLLGANRHCANGIMRAHWSEKEMRCASAGSLSFLPQQTVVMRAEVQKRLKLLVAFARPSAPSQE